MHVLPVQVGGYLTLGETLSPLQLAGAGVTLAAVWAITHRAEEKEPAKNEQ